MQASSEHATADAQVAMPADVDLHARPAAEFVRTVMCFSSKVWVAVGERDPREDARERLGDVVEGVEVVV